MFRPLLAYNKELDLDALRYPLAASFKYDGFRALVVRDRGAPKLVSRNLETIPNAAIFKMFSIEKLVGFDGELIVGDPTEPDCFSKTSSKVTTEHGDAFDVRFFVFDTFLRPEREFRDRHAQLRTMTLPPSVHLVTQQMINTPKQAKEHFEIATSNGYEGIMLRSLNAVYKFGRSTLNEHALLKVKLAEDSEAIVIQVLPRMRNDNPQERDKRGYAKRSTKKEGKVALAEAGKFVVRDVKTKKEFECGTGIMTQSEREEAWRMRYKLKGKILKYRFQPSGVKELPRFPRFIGWRSRIDF